MYFTVEGKIKGKGRPRFNRQTGSVYTPAETKEYESIIASTYVILNGKRIPKGTPVDIYIFACFAIPKSWPKDRRERCLLDQEKPLKKPDIDNIAKIVLDALNGVAYDDDTQVVTCRCEKHYANAERLSIFVGRHEENRAYLFAGIDKLAE